MENKKPKMKNNEDKNVEPLHILENPKVEDKIPTKLANQNNKEWTKRNVLTPLEKCWTPPENEKTQQVSCNKYKNHFLSKI